MRRIDSTLFDLILDNLPVGVGVFDTSGRIIWANATLLTWLDISAEALTGTLRGDRLPEHIGALLTQAENIIIPPAAARRARTLAVQHVRVQREGSDVARINYYRDISQLPEIEPALRALEEKTEQLALTDPVTGLPNRRAIVRALEPMVSRSRRYSNPLSVVILNVGNLAGLTVEGGARSAEKVAVAVGQLLRDQTRWADMVGRIDDTSFAFVLQETTKADAEKLVDKINAGMARLEVPEAVGESQPLRCNFGIAEWRMGDDVKSLLERAQGACAAEE